MRFFSPLSASNCERYPNQTESNHHFLLTMTCFKLAPKLITLGASLLLYFNTCYLRGKVLPIHSLK